MTISYPESEKGAIRIKIYNVKIITLKIEDIHNNNKKIKLFEIQCPSSLSMFNINIRILHID